MQISAEIRASTSAIRLHIDCYQKYNPVPEKSEEMREKIKLFAGQNKDKHEEKGQETNEEIRRGKVSEIVASFSAPSIRSSVKERSSTKVIIPSHFVNQNFNSRLQIFSMKRSSLCKA